jgi:hypothetical protein
MIKKLTSDEEMQVFEAGWEAMFPEPWDGTQAVIMGSAWDAMSAKADSFTKPSYSDADELRDLQNSVLACKNLDDLWTTQKTLMAILRGEPL